MVDDVAHAIVLLEQLQHLPRQGVDELRELVPIHAELDRGFQRRQCRREAIPLVDLSQTFGDDGARRGLDLRCVAHVAGLEAEGPGLPVEDPEERLFSPDLTDSRRPDLALVEGDQPFRKSVRVPLLSQAHATGRSPQMQHLEQLRGAQLGQRAAELELRRRPLLEHLDPLLALEQGRDRVEHLLALDAEVEVKVAQAPGRDPVRIATQEDEANTPGAWIRAQDLRQLRCIHQGKVHLRHDDGWLLGQGDLETHRSVGCDPALMARRFQDVGDALPPCGIAICDEDELVRHDHSLPLWTARGIASSRCSSKVRYSTRALSAVWKIGARAAASVIWPTIAKAGPSPK